MSRRTSRVIASSLIRVRPLRTAALLAALPGATLLSPPPEAHAQTTATWIGGASGDYNVAANWEIGGVAGTGIVPINSFNSDTYTVVLPDGVDVLFTGLGTGNVVDRLEFGNGARLTASAGSTLTDVTGSIIDNALLASESGGQLDVSATSYVNARNATETIFSASGAGSVLDASSLQSLRFGNGNGRRVKTIQADADGL
ncbi:MAG: hypothetical protein AAGH92_07685, partial [Planctomycetota bacterium]